MNIEWLLAIIAWSFWAGAAAGVVFYRRFVFRREIEVLMMERRRAQQLRDEAVEHMRRASCAQDRAIELERRLRDRGEDWRRDADWWKRE